MRHIDDNFVVSFARTDGIKRTVGLQIDLHTQDQQDTDKISMIQYSEAYKLAILFCEKKILKKHKSEAYENSQHTKFGKNRKIYVQDEA